MFNALDHLNGWQLILVLSPVVLIMTFIKKREDYQNSIKLDGLNNLQKGWVFLTLLSPGLAASILNLLSEEERNRIIGAGGSLRGMVDRVALPCMDPFFVAAGLKGVPSKDVDEVLRFLNIKYQDEPKELLGYYRKAYL